MSDSDDDIVYMGTSQPPGKGKHQTRQPRSKSKGKQKASNEIGSDFVSLEDFDDSASFKPSNNGGKRSNQTANTNQQQQQQGGATGTISMNGQRLGNGNGNHNNAASGPSNGGGQQNQAPPLTKAEKKALAAANKAEQEAKDKRVKAEKAAMAAFKQRNSNLSSVVSQVMSGQLAASASGRDKGKGRADQGGPSGSGGGFEGSSRSENSHLPAKPGGGLAMALSNASVPPKPSTESSSKPAPIKIKLAERITVSNANPSSSNHQSSRSVAPPDDSSRQYERDRQGKYDNRSSGNAPGKRKRGEDEDLSDDGFPRGGPRFDPDIYSSRDRVRDRDYDRGDTSRKHQRTSNAPMYRGGMNVFGRDQSYSPPPPPRRNANERGGFARGEPSYKPKPSGGKYAGGYGNQGGRHGPPQGIIDEDMFAREDTYSAKYVTPWVDLFDFKAEKSLPRMLNGEIRAAYEWMSPTPEEHAVRQKMVDIIRGIVCSRWPHARVYAFGSHETGLYLPQADIDIVIDENSPGMQNITPTGQDRNKVKPNHISHMGPREADVFKDQHAKANAVLSRISQELRTYGITRNIEHVRGAAVPVLKFKTEQGQLLMDISFSKLNGLASIDFINRFLEHWPALRPLIMIIKAWLSQNNWNEVKNGGMSSYSVICMWISQFQYNLRIKEAKLDPDTMLFTLLLDFFKYFAGKQHFAMSHNYDVTTLCIAESRDHAFPWWGRYERKERLGFQNNGKNYDKVLLSIEDPCSPGHDISKGTFAMSYIADAMREAYEFLDDAERNRFDEFKDWEASSFSVPPPEWEDARSGELDPNKVSILRRLIRFRRADLHHRKVLADLYRTRGLDLMLTRVGGTATKPKLSLPIGSGSVSQYPASQAGPSSSSTARHRRSFTPEAAPAQTQFAGVMLNDADPMSNGDYFTDSSEDFDSRRKRPSRVPVDDGGEADMDMDIEEGETAGGSGSAVPVVHYSETGAPDAAGSSSTSRLSNRERREQRDKRNEYWKNKGAMQQPGSASSSTNGSRRQQQQSRQQNQTLGWERGGDYPDSEAEEASAERMIIDVDGDGSDGEQRAMFDEAAMMADGIVDAGVAIEEQADFVPL